MLKICNVSKIFENDDKIENVLQNINLNIQKQEIVSLVGHSGSGKSTILNLIPRFYNADEGDIQIDGQSIYKTTIKSLRQNISLVSQETTLFDDTILNNIKYSNENASNEEIYKVAELSNCAEFINKLPNKYRKIIYKKELQKFYPKHIEFDTMNKRFRWQCVPKLPILDIPLILKFI